MTLEGDLEDIQESVAAITRQGARSFGLSQQQFEGRQRFVRDSQS